MSKNTNQPTANEQNNQAETQPKKQKKAKAPKRNIDFSPVASAMFEIQRREATSDVISGLVCILIGLILVIVSIAKYIQNMKAVDIDADKIFAYAWVAMAIAGVFMGVIGVYEILKSFISLEQINEWAKNADSHTSPLQALHGKKTVKEPTPAENTSSDNAAPQQESSKSADNKRKPPFQMGAAANKAPVRPQPPANNMAQPPRAKPMMEQKFDYGIHEEKKMTFADKFLAENKEDPFAQYRRDLGIEEPKKEEEYVQKPQFIRSAQAQQQGNVSAAPPAQERGGFPAGSLYDQVSGSSNQDNDDDGFFFGTSTAGQPPQVDVKDKLKQVQQQLEEVKDFRQQLQQVQQVQQEIREVQEQVIEAQKSNEQFSRMYSSNFGSSETQPHELDDFFMSSVPKEPPSVDLNKPSDTIKPPSIPQFSAQPTIKPPPIPKSLAQPTIKPPPIPQNSAQPTIKPPPIPQNSAQPTIKPPPIPDYPAQSVTPPPIPGNRMPQSAQPYPNNMIGSMPRGPQMPQMPQMPRVPYNMGGGMPQQMRPPMGYPQQMQPLPNMRPAQGNMPNQNFGASPFGFVGSFVDPMEQSYNSSMPPYTVHPFKPAQGGIAAPQIMPQEQSYNSSMPPYTVHPFKPAQGGIAAPQIAPQEQSYNSSMPPYTVHPFKPADGGLAAPQIAPQEQSFNMSETAGSSTPPSAAGKESKARPSNTLSIVPPKPDSDYNLDTFLGQDTSPKTDVPKKEQPLPTPEPKEDTPKQESAAKSADEQKSKRRGSFTLRTADSGSSKKSPITQRLGEYRISLFEELGGAPSRPSRGSVRSKKESAETDDKSQQSDNNTGGNGMQFSGRKEPERKMSFSEKFLNRNGKKAAEKISGASGEIVQNGTPAQRKFVDASEYDEWVCPGCGSTNQEYVGICACGERKPRNTW